MPTVINAATDLYGAPPEALADYLAEYEAQVARPGRFEGEPRYVPFFWALYLEGCADADDGDVITFDVTAEDRAIFPELENVAAVLLEQTDDGFIYSATRETR